MQRMLHANRGRLLLLTPGPFPLWDLHVECRDQSLLNLSCLRTFEFWTSLGNSLLLLQMSIHVFRLYHVYVRPMKLQPNSRILRELPLLASFQHFMPSRMSEGIPVLFSVMSVLSSFAITFEPFDTEASDLACILIHKTTSNDTKVYDLNTLTVTWLHAKKAVLDFVAIRIISFHKHTLSLPREMGLLTP